MTEEEFYNSLSNKKIGIKALLLDQSFISGIGNWVADEVLYHARIHPLQTTSSMSKESCETLRKCINEVIKKAIEVGADSSQFPSNWIFHFREKKSGKAFVDGKEIGFITAGGRTTAYVPELQKLTGDEAVKEAGKSAAGATTGNDDDVDESGDKDEPVKLKAVKGKKSSRARKPSSKKKSSASTEDSDNDVGDNSADDVPSKRTKGAKKPPAKSKPKGRTEHDGEGRRQPRGKTAPVKREHEESDPSGSADEDEDEEPQKVMNGKRAKAAASSNKRAASNQNTKRKKKA
ncbi:DNA-(apurinic or apyrimidinic site) lyase [Handroanthus impetiginosus]|uniref:DNA-(Apurinic or apyrimidinic site) lyase n=1 Tax=Handroanthus impetiginosus TaxID=429701 RepID=A0A2G9GNT2_9LAMI|nr:DNA-(apurinic or apyrimidinic site) lyase [Handroanthus impetiginosus]